MAQPKLAGPGPMWDVLDQFFERYGQMRVRLWFRERQCIVTDASEPTAPEGYTRGAALEVDLTKGGAASCPLK